MLICDEEELNFYLGVPRAAWLVDAPREASLFISHRVLAPIKRLPRPEFRHYAVDSSAFTELQKHGRFRTSPHEYIEALLRYDDQIGSMAWAAPQDWMCEPAVISGGTWNRQHFAGTGLSITEHQHRTVLNFIELQELWPKTGAGDCPVMPVLQGWTIDDYLRCFQLYQDAGVRLAEDYPVVGVGSVCRRQNTTEIGEIFRELAALDLPLHGFGVKLGGLLRYGRWLTTADSMAWSDTARHKPPAPDCAGHRKHCGNCLHEALAWRTRLLTRLHTTENPHGGLANQPADTTDDREHDARAVVVGHPQFGDVTDPQRVAAADVLGPTGDRHGQITSAERQRRPQRPGNAETVPAGTGKQNAGRRDGHDRGPFQLS